MSDFKSLFLLEDFKAYRRKQAELIASTIEADVYNSLKGTVDHYQYMAGKMEMANALLKLPSELTNDTGLQEILDRQLVEDMAHITKFLMRRRFTEDE